MIRFRNFLPLVAVLVGAAILGAPTRAHAAFTLTLHETGFTDVVVTDGGGGDVAALGGVITFAGNFGDFTIQVTTGSSNSAAGVQPAQLTINSLAITSMTGVVIPSAPLVITLADTGFTAPTPGLAGMESQLSTTQAPQGTNVTFQSFVNATPGTLLNLNGVGGQVVDELVTVPGGPSYALSNVTTITLTQSGTVQTTGITLVAVPAPAGVVLALTAGPFLGMGYWLRRRKTV